MSTLRLGTAIAVAALALTGTADAAKVTLAVDATQKVTLVPLRGGGFPSSTTSLTFIASVTNDAGAPAVAPIDQPKATVDLVARTADGDKVVGTSTIVTAGPVALPPVVVDQNTTFFARLNAAPAVGVAAQANSNAVPIRVYLRNTLSVTNSAAKRTATFAGSYAQVAGIPARDAVRVLIQRRKSRMWKLVAKVVPDANGTWTVAVPTGAAPSVFRVRTVPITPVRYVKVTENGYCFAAASVLATRTCKGVPWSAR